MFDPIHEKVRKWLEIRIKHSEKALDNGWIVEVDDEDPRSMVIDTPKMPFKLTVLVEERITFIALITAVHTVNASNDDAAGVFRTLLQKNRTMEISKFFLTSDADTICLRTDLYTDHMNKNEFNIALESVILGGRWLIAQLGETEDANRLAKEMVTLGSAELVQGTSEEDVVAMMIEAGYPEDQAHLLISKLKIDLGMAEPAEDETEAATPATEETDEDVYVPTEPTGENPVDRYIW